MPTTVVEADATIRLHYTAAGIEHAHNLRVSLQNPFTLGDMPTIKSATGSGSNRSSDDFVSMYIGFIVPYYKAADSFVGYEVFNELVVPHELVFARTLTGFPGTHTGTEFQRAEGGSVLTFRDKLGKKCKFYWFGTVDDRLGRAIAVADSPMSALVTEMLDTAAGHIGDYVSGRSAARLMTFMSHSKGANNALEKKILFG